MSEFIERIRTRLLKHNKNWLCIIVGGTGSGKSYAALRLAETLDPDFNIDRVVFSAKEFMELTKDPTLHAGNFIVYDEAGTSLGSRDFMTRVNKAINYFLQSWRCLNMGLIFTLPSLGMLDSQARILSHCVLETNGIDRSDKVCFLKPLNVEHNPIIDKTYRKYPRKTMNGEIFKINRLRVHKPSVKLQHRYEKKKSTFLDELSKTVIGKLEDQKPKKTTATDLNVLIEQIIKDPKPFFDKDKKEKRLDKLLIRHAFNVSYRNATYIRKVAEKQLGIVGTPQELPKIII